MVDLASLPPALVTTEEMGRLVRSLKLGSSSGLDGIMAEHLKHALSQVMCNLLCCLINTCTRFAVTPESCALGLLVPVLKKPSLDAAAPRNYRPITISSTFSKLLEKLILSRSAQDFDCMQFGFREGVGTLWPMMSYLT